MHEASITEGLIRILVSEAAQIGATEITKVTLKIGRLQAVEPQSLSLCFEIFSENTIAENARLQIDHLVAKAYCNTCEQVFEVPGFRFKCTHCHSTDLTVVQGEELFIDSFEVKNN